MIWASQSWNWTSTAFAGVSSACARADAIQAGRTVQGAMAATIVGIRHLSQTTFSMVVKTRGHDSVGWTGGPHRLCHHMAALVLAGSIGPGRADRVERLLVICGRSGFPDGAFSAESRDAGKPVRRVPP